MSVLIYALIALVPVLCVAWIIWSYRRKAAARVAARSERLAEILGAGLEKGATAAPAAADAAQAAPAPLPAAPVPGTDLQPAPAAIAAAPLYAAKPLWLDPPRARLYEALRRGLPEHTVFALVSLAALLDVPPAVQGRAREQRLRALGQYTADCVICGADMRVLAVVDAESTLDADARFKADCLKAAGIRHVRVDPAQLAAGTGLRALILG